MTPEQILMYHFKRRNEGGQTITDQLRRFAHRWYARYLVKMLRIERERQLVGSYTITLPSNEDWTLDY